MPGSTFSIWWKVPVTLMALLILFAGRWLGSEETSAPSHDSIYWIGMVLHACVLLDVLLPRLAVAKLLYPLLFVFVGTGIGTTLVRQQVHAPLALGMFVFVMLPYALPLIAIWRSRYHARNRPASISKDSSLPRHP